MSSSARAIADVTEGTILASVDIMVPPERVFTALSDGAEIARWWGAPDVYTTERWTTDFRVGGRWRADGKGADGAPFFVEGEFIAIERPWRIVQTWEPGWTPGLKTTITYQLSPIAGGTRLVVRHEGFGDNAQSCEGHSEGWVRVLGWLVAGIVPKPAPAPDTAKYFLARLLGPRPDFATTLTPEERAMMQAHAIYWQQHMATGKVLVLGPVNDPKGSWGLAVMRVTSDAELRELQKPRPRYRHRAGHALRQRAAVSRGLEAVTETAPDRLLRLARAAGLPEVEAGTSYGQPALKVAGKAFTGYRGEDALPIRLPAEQKEFLLEMSPGIYFETDHYKGSSWLLIRLRDIDDEELMQRLVDAWRFRAPKKLAAGFHG